MNVDLAKAVKQLRLALAIPSQEKLAEMGASHGLTRLDVQAVEGKKKANSYNIRKALAAAFGLTFGEFDDYVEERIPLSRIVVLCSDRSAPDRAPLLTLVPLPPAPALPPSPGRRTIPDHYPPALKDWLDEHQELDPQSITVLEVLKAARLGDTELTRQRIDEHFAHKKGTGKVRAPPPAPPTEEPDEFADFHANLKGKPKRAAEPKAATPSTIPPPPKPTKPKPRRK